MPSGRTIDYTPTALAIAREPAARRGVHHPLQSAHVLAVTVDASRSVPARALASLGAVRRSVSGEAV